MRRFPLSARFLGATLAVALSLARPPPAFAAPSEPPPVAVVSPEAVKAAFLVNFVSFTDWPEGVPPAAAPYAIGISGSRALEDELIRFADHKLVRGRRLRVVRIKSAADLDGLHLAYFDSASDEQADGLAAADALPFLRHQPVLTVSDAADFTAAGGMIRIFREEKALRFEIAPEVARDAGLVLSSRLLSLARIYRAPTGASARKP